MNNAVIKTVAALLAILVLFALSTQADASTVTSLSGLEHAGSTSSLSISEFLNIDTISIPIVIWLFNGALFGLLGLARRKQIV
jgi:hypothetical protein